MKNASTLRVVSLVLTSLAALPGAYASSLDSPLPTVDNTGPPRRAPHDSAKKFADQLDRAAASVVTKLTQLPPAKTHSEKGVRREVASFAQEANALRRHLTRFLIDKNPAYKSIERLNRIAWGMHKSLDKAPKYRAIWGNWARTVSLLRRLQRAMPRK